MANVGGSLSRSRLSSGLFCSWRVAWSIWSSALRNARRYVVPAGVSLMPCCVRSTSWVPSHCSSERTCRLTAPCVTDNSRAARVTLPLRPVASKARTAFRGGRRRSIGGRLIPDMSFSHSHYEVIVLAGQSGGAHARRQASPEGASSTSPRDSGDGCRWHQRPCSRRSGGAMSSTSATTAARCCTSTVTSCRTVRRRRSRCCASAVSCRGCRNARSPPPTTTCRRTAAASRTCAIPNRRAWRRRSTTTRRRRASASSASTIRARASST